MYHRTTLLLLRLLLSCKLGLRLKALPPRVSQSSSFVNTLLLSTAATLLQLCFSRTLALFRHVTQFTTFIYT